jgi:hypothetical protein
MTICKFIEQQPYEQWTGYMDELLTKLNAIASEDYKKMHSWPKSARFLSEKLQRIETGLRAIDIIVELKARINTDVQCLYGPHLVVQRCSSGVARKILVKALLERFYGLLV